jgi:MFS family permease
MNSAWLTLAASFVILAVYRVVSSSFAILVLPLQDELVASRATVTLIFTVHMLVYSVTSLLCGVAIDRIGPRPTIALGGLLLGLGLAVMSAAQTLAGLTLAFGLLCGSGVALVGLPANFVILSERFPSRIATVMGVAGAGMGVGVLVLIPAIQFAADRVGWRAAFLWFGVAAALIVALCAALQRLHGRTGRAAKASRDAPVNAHRNQGHGVVGRSAGARMLEIVRSAKWRGFAGANFLMGSALFGVLTHQVALLRESGWSAMAAATALGSVNVLRSAAGPLWGIVLDRFGRRLGYGLSMVLAIAGLASVVIGSATWLRVDALAYVFIAAFGIGSAGTLPTNASLGNELFSREQRAIAWGFTETAYAAGAAFGSWAVGWLFDLNGNYTAALALTGLQFIGSYLLVLLLSPHRPTAQATADL